MYEYSSKFGTILKRETLASIRLSDRSPNLVLQSADPFPGYYCSEEQPTDNSCKENAYYIPIQDQVFADFEIPCRISLELQQEMGVNICPAYFHLEETAVSAFRVKEIKESQLLVIMKHLKEKGMKLHKQRKVKRFLSYIHLKSFFELERLENNIYKNNISEGLYYITIEEKLDWEKFEKVITFQKSNSRFKNFDAAIGYWIEKPSFTDFVRIYGIDLEMKQLKTIESDFHAHARTLKRQGMVI